MNRYLKKIIINANSSMSKAFSHAFSLVRDAFQDENVSAFKSFHRDNIKSQNDLMIAYHEKQIVDAQKSYIDFLNTKFKDVVINSRISNNDDEDA